MTVEMHYDKKRENKDEDKCCLQVERRRLKGEYIRPDKCRP